MVTDRDEFLYIVGYKDQIEFWNLPQKMWVEIYNWESLDDDRTDVTHFYYNEHTDEILGISEQSIIFWNVNKFEEVEINKKNYLK